MNLVILQTIIATAGVVVGATLTAIASAYASRQKIREIELTYRQKIDEQERLYRQKLDENHIANARPYVNTLYIPINIILTKLEDAYDKFIAACNLYERYDEDEVEEFSQACFMCISEIRELFNKGSDAFLTEKLEEQLRVFIKFLDTSRDEIGENEIKWSQFGKLLRDDIRTLKALIKDVTLGTNSTSKPEQFITMKS